MIKRSLSLIIIFCFFLTTLGPLPQAHGSTTLTTNADSVLGLPAPGTMINLSPAYEPVMIKGLTVHKDNPFLFDFIVDVGQDRMSGEPLKKEGEKLIKYFLASLAIPDKDVWVNLSPYEKNRMIPEVLGQTDMGRDLLEQDYILKQITASLIYPEKKLGKAFWDKVYSKAQEMYGTTQVPVNTFNKVWIMADRAEVFEHNQTAFVVDSHLKVMLEEDYLALQKHNGITPGSPTVIPAKAGIQNTTHSIASQIVKSIILPELEKEVNTGKNFANLRQIFNSVILSSWYKRNLKEALLNQVYANRSKIKGIQRPSSTVVPAKAGIQSLDETETIYQQYLKAYKKGVFNYIKEDINTASGQTIPRKYFSGGIMKIGITPAMTTDTKTMAAISLEAQRGTLDEFSTGLKLNNAMLAYSPGRQLENILDAFPEDDHETRGAIVEKWYSKFNEKIPNALLIEDEDFIRKLWDMFSIPKDEGSDEGSMDINSTADLFLISLRKIISNQLLFWFTPQELIFLLSKLPAYPKGASSAISGDRDGIIRDLGAIYRNIELVDRPKVKAEVLSLARGNNIEALRKLAQGQANWRSLPAVDRRSAPFTPEELTELIRKQLYTDRKIVAILEFFRTNPRLINSVDALIAILSSPSMEQREFVAHLIQFFPPDLERDRRFLGPLIANTRLEPGQTMNTNIQGKQKVCSDTLVVIGGRSPELNSEIKEALAGADVTTINVRGYLFKQKHKSKEALDPNELTQLMLKQERVSHARENIEAFYNANQDQLINSVDALVSILSSGSSMNQRKFVAYLIPFFPPDLERDRRFLGPLIANTKLGDQVMDRGVKTTFINTLVAIGERSSEFESTVKDALESADSKTTNGEKYLRNLRRKSGEWAVVMPFTIGYWSHSDHDIIYPVRTVDGKFFWKYLYSPISGKLGIEYKENGKQWVGYIFVTLVNSPPEAIPAALTSEEVKGQISEYIKDQERVGVIRQYIADKANPPTQGHAANVVAGGKSSAMMAVNGGPSIETLKNSQNFKPFAVASKGDKKRDVYYHIAKAKDHIMIVQTSNPAMGSVNRVVTKDNRLLNGGIDLNTTNGMQWKDSKEGKGVEMDIDPAMIARIKREGVNSLSPVIFKITPVTNIWPLVG